MESRPLYITEERVKTFKNWPFSDKDKCNVRNMAGAGFYSVATGTEDADAAKCFLCGKELDGWESTDDPWEEHKSHAANCAFVQLGKKEDDLLEDSVLLAKAGLARVAVYYHMQLGLPDVRNFPDKSGLFVSGKQLTEFCSIIKQYMVNEIKRLGENAKDQIDDRVKLIKRKYIGKK